MIILVLLSLNILKCEDISIDNKFTWNRLYDFNSTVYLEINSL
jgi:hypothetical protein